jgi:hypothetical protein
MRSTDVLISLGIRKNSHSSERDLLLYLFIERVIKLVEVIAEGMSLLPTICKMLSNILVSKLTPYVGEIIGDHQCGFRR